jgi:hypothetical protein
MILSAIDQLPTHVRPGLLWGLLVDESTTLSSIADAVRDDDDPVDALARSLDAEMLIGDLDEVAGRLGDAEPWATIRLALAGAAAGWRKAHPTLRSVHDRRQAGR